MTKRSRWLVLAVCCLVLGATLFGLRGKAETERDRQRAIAQIVKTVLERYHFAKHPFDDSLSERAFDLYIKRLDFGKRFLLAGDVTALARHRKSIDEELESGNLALMRDGAVLLRRRVREVRAAVSPFFAQPLSFTEEAYLELDAEKRGFPETPQDRLEFWHRVITLDVLDRALALEKEQTEAVEKGEREGVDSLAVREAEAREASKKSWHAIFRRLLQRDDQDELRDFLNAVTMAYDPHTTYLPPRDQENFDIQMSGSLEGIGALLREEDEYVKIVEIIPGGAAWRDGRLQADDCILRVGQGVEEPVDIIGMRLEDAVQLIRGPKGTVVRLTVRKADGSVETIPIIRDVVVVEATYAKVALLEQKETGLRLGYVLLPSFYRDFTHEGLGRNCADDMRSCLSVLGEKGIDGLVLDVRNNGGGSLRDVVDIAGFFIEQGPIVQVNDMMGQKRILTDKDADVLYDGPMVVLTNAYSASASEILASALKDYGRSVVVGAATTHGKGTVQGMMPLDRFVAGAEERPDLGTLKLTIQKFYRVNGSSTQVRGVVPDIVLPDPLDYIESGERELDFALAWSSIPPAQFRHWGKHHYDREALAKQSATRVKQSEKFQKVERLVALMEERRNETQAPLWLAARKAEQEERKREVDAMEYDEPSDTIDILFYDSNAGRRREKPADEKLAETIAEKDEKLKEALLGDPYVEEVFNILSDMIGQLKDPAPAVPQVAAEQ